MWLRYGLNRPLTKFARVQAPSEAGADRRSGVRRLRAAGGWPCVRGARLMVRCTCGHGVQGAVRYGVHVGRAVVQTQREG